MNPRHLTEDAQAQAIAAWGRGSSFRCVACDKDSAGSPARSVPTSFTGLSLGACAPCARRLQESAGFRRQTAENARGAGVRVVVQRMADLVGVDGRALAEALRDVSIGHDLRPDALRLVDAALGLPVGSVQCALQAVLRLGNSQ